jgi:ligand-binding sensor domain-containing protein
MPVDKRLLILIQLILIVGIIFTLALWIAPSVVKPAQKEMPIGWQIIRPPNDISALAIQGNIVWAGGTDGVVGLDRTKGNVIQSVECNPPLAYVRALLVDRQGELWIGHQSGLTSYDGNSCRTLTHADGLPSDRVNALLQDRSGRLWIGTSCGAAVYDGKTWRALNTTNGLADDMVNVMLEDRQGGIWFGSYVAPRGGISYLKNGSWQKFSTENGLPHNNIDAFFEDKEGNLWAGTGLYDRGGAVRFAPTKSGWAIQEILTSRDGLAGNKARSIFQDRDGMLWIGSEYDGLARREAGSWRVLTEKDGLSDPEVKCIVQDVDGNLWMGTKDGVTRLNATALNALHNQSEASDH